MTDNQTKVTYRIAAYAAEHLARCLDTLAKETSSDHEKTFFPKLAAELRILAESCGDKGFNKST